MKLSYIASPEPLESRIAPAGLVTATFLNGTLTINGADGADHDVEIVKTGRNEFRVDGNATGINNAGQATQSFEGVLKNVLIDGGIGADTFRVTDLSPLKSFQFNGDAGVDSLTTTKLKMRVGSQVNIDLGSETGSVEFGGKETTVRGVLNVDLGGGGTVNFSSPATTIDSEARITGSDGSDSFSITGASTTFKSSLTFTGGDGNDSFNGAGTVLKVKGAVTMDGGAGTDTYVFAADTNKFGTALAPAMINLQMGSGSGMISFLGTSTKVFGNLALGLGSGGGTAQLHSATTAISQNLQVTGGAGDDILTLKGSTTVGGSLSFLGDAGDDALTASSSLFRVAGTMSMDAGSGASMFALDVVTLALASLSVTGGTLNDTVRINADGVIAGDVNLELGMDGTGPSSTILQSRAGIANGLAVAGALTIDMVGATVDFLTIANVQVAGPLVVQTGGNVSTVDISQLNAKGDFTLRTGAGADVVNIDNVRSRGFYVNTESGADELRIERNASYTGTSQVRGVATILTEVGADQIRIGDSSNPANLKVSFMQATTLDAGDGANMRNDILASNFFKIAPTIVATGGVLTQTEAA